MKKSFNEQELENIINRYNQGESLHKISKTTGADWHWLERQFQQRNIEIRRQMRLRTDYFDEINSPNKAYILGFIYADGCNEIDEERKRYCLSISVEKTDIDVLQQIQNELNHTKNLTLKTNNHGTEYYTLSLCSKKLCYKLKELGVVPKKSLVKQFPTYIPNELIPHFIRGYFDGNGSLIIQKRSEGDCYKPSVSATITSTEDMCLHFSSIVQQKCNVTTHVYDICKEGACKDKIKSFRVIGNNQTKQFLDYIYKDADLKMNRKYQKYLNWYY